MQKHIPIFNGPAVDFNAVLNIDNRRVLCHVYVTKDTRPGCFRVRQIKDAGAAHHIWDHPAKRLTGAAIREQWQNDRRFHRATVKASIVYERIAEQG